MRIIYIPIGLSLALTVAVSGLTSAQDTSSESAEGFVPLEVTEECKQKIYEELQEERNIYRNVQHAATQDAVPYQKNASVLHTMSANTTDLVPYLVLNYHALACRLELVCDSIWMSHGHVSKSPVLSHRPIGCSRLFMARGRWWSDERRDDVFKSDDYPIEECAYYKEGSQAVATAFLVKKNPCQSIADQILAEENQMLRLIVAEDSANRGTRKIVPVFQAVLRDIRDSFLEPLRGLADLFGSVIHPIPCLLTQCN